MRAILLPPEIRTALESGAALCISISGGKDSQALLNALVAVRQEHGWSGPVFAAHADLGRAEWPQSLPHCEKLCADLGIELIVVRRPQGDLVQEIQDRMEKLAGTGRQPWPTATQRYCTADQKRDQLTKIQRAPHWPSATNRYCTSDQKRAQIDKVMRPYPVIVSAQGIRAEESAARSKKPVCAIQASITAKRLRALSPAEALSQQGENQRVALNWYPLFDWTLDDVWEACNTSQAEIDHRRFLYRLGWEEEAFDGWPAHPAYVMGNDRVSCAICVLASENDIINGARHNPDLFHTYQDMERKSGFTFRQGLALTDLELTP